MNDTDATDFMSLVAARRGHFRHESGYHSALWLDLDALFASPRRIAPLVAALATSLKPFAAEVICGPLLGGAFLAQMLAHALDVEFCFTERVMPVQREGLFPARYALPGAFSERVRGRRIALVDDVMSAGSALRGTHAEVLAHGAIPSVVGALVILGSTGTDFFAERNLPVAAVARERYALWLPSDCPLCAAGTPFEDVAVSRTT